MTSNIKEMGAHYHGKDLPFRRRPVGLNPPRFNYLATAMTDPVLEAIISASIGQSIPNRPAQAARMRMLAWRLDNREISDWLIEVADLLDPQDMAIPTDEVCQDIAISLPPGRIENSEIHSTRFFAMSLVPAFKRIKPWLEDMSQWLS